MKFFTLLLCSFFLVSCTPSNDLDCTQDEEIGICTVPQDIL